MNRSEEDEQTSPIPDGTVCQAECTFSAEFPHDLPFEEGDTLTIIGPCNKVFWYLAEDRWGRRGVVPINHLLLASTTTVAPPPEDRHQFPLPPVDRPPFPLPPEDRPQFPLPPEDRPQFPLPPADRPQFPLPPVDRPQFPPHPADRPPATLPTVHRAPATPPTVHRAPATPPTVHRPPGTTGTSRPPSSRRSGDDYSYGERPPLSPPEQRRKSGGNTATLPPDSCKYRDVLAFRAKSGWCMPSVDEVLMKKAQFANMLLFQKMRVGIYVFQHKTIANLKFVGKSYELYYELCRMFENIYSKPIHHLSPIEEQLRFYHPDANEWHLRIYSCRMDELELSLAKRIILTESLTPRGLNRELTFIGKEAWEDFCIWLAEQRKGRPSRNP